MGKYKHILTILILSYLLSLILSGIVEDAILKEKSRQLQFVMKTAGEMALQQAQVTDDFFKEGSSFVISDSYGTHEAFKFVNFGANNDTIIQQDLYATFFGKQERHDIYKEMYAKQGSNFKQALTKNNLTDKLAKVPFTYYLVNNMTNKLYAVEAPAVMQMGMQSGVTKADKDKNFTGSDNFGSEFNKNGASQVLANQDATKGYELNSVTKESRKKDTKGSEKLEHYYITPLSLGVTYLDEQLLQALFINNVNLLMRSQYLPETTTKNTTVVIPKIDGVAGGKGIIKGLYSNDLNMQTGNNEVSNNGLFSAIIGRKTLGNNQFFGGTTPLKITYKVIDMYSDAPETQEVIKQTLGVIPKKKFQEAGVPQGEYGKYYKKIDELNISETSGSKQKRTTKPMVVAKVDFNLDVVIPYTTLAMRELRLYSMPDNNSVQNRLLFEYNTSKINNQNNYLDMAPRQNGNSKQGFRNVVYSTYFAVAP